MNKHNVGRSLASKSPLALIFNVLLFVLLAAFDGTLILSNMLYAIVFGLGCAALLLGYWHEKGGYLFILALLMPLFLIIMSELTSFVALAWVINGYFCGFALALLIYKLSYLKKHSS